MIYWFAKNDVAANLLMLTLLALGLGSLKFNIPLEVFPSIEPRAITINVAVPGTLPEDIETGVSVKLEESIQDLEGIDVLTSRSFENSGQVLVTLIDGYDPQDMLAQIKNRVDAINNLPADAERPVVSLATRKREVISVAVSGDLSEREIRHEAERLRDQILALDGVSQVELDGVRDYEVSIELREESLRKYGLAMADVAAAIKASSQDISAGSLRTSGGEILLRSSGRAFDAEEFNGIVVVQGSGGAQVRLEQIAQVHDDFVEDVVVTRFNGKTAAFVYVYRVGNESAIEVADTVRQFLEEKRQTSPSVTLTPWRDRSLIVKKRLNTLTNNAIQGGILVMLLLALFLRPAIAFWVCVGIPV